MVYTSVLELGSIKILNELLVPPDPTILLADASIVIIDVVEYPVLFMPVNVIGLEKFKLPFVNILPLISLVLTLAKVLSLKVPTFPP